MIDQSLLWQWLVHAAVLSGLVLVIGAVAVRMCRQPVYRLRLIQWVLIGCVVAPWLHILSPWTPYSLGLIASHVEVADNAAALPFPATVATVSAQNQNESVQPADVGTVWEKEESDVGTTVTPNQRQHQVASASKSAASTDTSALRPINDEVFVDGKNETSRFAAFNWSPAAVVGILYLMAIALIGLRWFVGMWRRALLARAARPASEEILQMFRQVAGRDAKHVRVIVSDQIDGPVTWGLFRPVIVLPSRFAENPDSSQLCWSLAHEWSHVERRDVGALLLATVAQLVCFYQPLFWWLKRQLILSQDYIADARAARETESAEDYAAFLVQLARTRLQPALPVALGMGDRRSRLFRRVKMLIDPSSPILRKCRPLPAILITVGALTFLATLSTIRLNAADEVSAVAAAADNKNLSSPKKAVAKKSANPKKLQKASKEKLKKLGVVTGQIVRADDGTPVGKAKIVMRGRKNFHGETDAQGRFRITDVPLGRYRVRARKGNLVSTQHRLQNLKSLDPKSNEVHFKPMRLTMKSGKRVKVIVTSAVTGRPLKAAKIRFSSPDRRKETTGIDGTVKVEGLMAATYQITVEAKGHARVDHTFDLSTSGEVTQISMALPAGGVVSGTVVDKKGQPVSNARVNYHIVGTPYGFSGDSPRTDAKGRFRYSHLPLGATVEVSVSKVDFIARSSKVALTADRREQNLVIELAPRPLGPSVAGIVKDKEGNPIAGATVKNWGRSSNQERTATTDGKGQFVLRDLYKSYAGTQITVRAKGFAPQHLQVVPDSDAEDGFARIVVSLKPGHFIHGQVKNESGRPLKDAYVYVYHSANRASEAVQTDQRGHFDIDSLPADSQFAFSKRGYSTRLKMPLTLDGESRVTVTLEPMGIIRGRVVDADTKKPIDHFNVRIGISPERRPEDVRGSYASRLKNPGVTFESTKGLFTLKELTNRMPFAVTVRARGYVKMALSRVVATRSEKAVSVDFALKRIDPAKMFTLKGQIHNHKGQPVPDAQLRLIVSTKQSRGKSDNRFNWELIKSGQLERKVACDQFLTAISDADGRFEFKNILPDKHIQLTYWGKDVPQGRMLELDKTKPGAKKSVTIDLPRPAKITGTFDIAKYPNVGEIAANIIRGAGHGYKVKLSKGQKKFEFSNLPPGDYSVIFMSKPYPVKSQAGVYRRIPLASQRFKLKAGETKKIHFGESNRRKRR